MRTYRSGRSVGLCCALAWLYTGAGIGQVPAPSCAPPLCVSRIDDDAAAPAPGTLRYAVSRAPEGAVITFDPSLNGKTIQLDRRSPVNHIKVAQSLSIHGPGSNLLTIDGGNATRIFFIASGTVQISGLTLARGLARGGDGGAATGGAGGGGGAAGLGGAILLNRGALALTEVVLSGNRASGGNGGGGGSGYGPGRGGGGGGFGGPSRGPAGGAASDLESNGASEGAGGTGSPSADNGGDGGWGGGGGGGGFVVQGSGGRGALGGPSGFAGGVGGAGGFLDPEGEGTAIPAGGGFGGSALGGAIFVRSGQLHLRDAVFLNNGAIAGAGGSGAPNGTAKGGALFVCSASFCGPGHDGLAIVFGKTLFRNNSAADAGFDPPCDGRDDADVCGSFTVPSPENETKR